MSAIKKKAKTKWILIAGCLGIFIVCALYLLSPFPVKDVNSISLPDKFDLPINAGFERQGKNQCAGFSTAFVLRSFDQKAKGIDVYTGIPYKIPISGYVLPKGVITYLQAQGFTTNLFQGDLGSLKSRLVQGGNPVIVLIGNGLLWQHYMTLIGYDNEKQELHFFDSGRDTDENAELPGNRTMTEEYFSGWWNNGLPLFNHIYITVEEAD